MPLPIRPVSRTLFPQGVESALEMLRVELVERSVDAEWSESDTRETVQAIVTCLRQSADFPLDRFAGSHRLPRDCLRRAVEIVNANLDSKVDWRPIAQAAGMTRLDFGRSFKLTTGLTLHQYVIRCRIRRAMRLLASTDRSIIDIALEVGCSGQSQFTTLFRQRTGTTPGIFRKAAKLGRAIPAIARAA